MADKYPKVTKYVNNLLEVFKFWRDSYTLKKENKVILGYWKLRALGAPVRYLLQYCGVKYENEWYEQGPEPEYSREAWFSQKEKLGISIPNLPYLCDGNFSISETLPIHVYIADKWCPALLGRTPYKNEAKSI